MLNHPHPSYEYSEDTALLADAGARFSSGAGRASNSAPAAHQHAAAGAAAAGAGAQQPGQMLPGTAMGLAHSCCPSEYDLEIIREVILIAEERARREYACGSGGREVTLLKLLRAYEQVRVCVCVCMFVCVSEIISRERSLNDG